MVIDFVVLLFSWIYLAGPDVLTTFILCMIDLIETKAIMTGYINLHYTRFAQFLISFSQDLIMRKYFSHFRVLFMFVLRKE